MTKDDGGPAFPSESFVRPNSDYGVEYDGMTLRDYFAAQALPAILSRFFQFSTKECTEYAYKVADAMLEARK